MNAKLGFLPLAILLSSGLNAVSQDLTIGNLVFRDLNNNGRFQAANGETGIDGVSVNLYRDANANNSIDPEEQPPLASTTTSGGGLYRFEALAPGSYFVEIALSNFGPGSPLEDMATSDFIEWNTNNDVDGDDNGFRAPPYGVLASRVDLGVGVEPTGEDGDPNTNLSVDFGFRGVQPVTVGDLVFRDANATGVFDTGDTGIDGVVLNLLRDANDNSGLEVEEYTPISTTTTAGGGRYSFAGVAPGYYWIEVASSNFTPGQPLENFASTEPSDGDANNGINDDDNGFRASPPLGVICSRFDVHYGLQPVIDDGDPNTDLTIDFGFRPVQPLTVGDLVFRDANANGVFDAADTGIDGVVVNLLRDANDNGGLEVEEYTPVATTTTSGGGRYSFSGMTPGNYWVEVAASNFASGEPLENLASTEPSDRDANNGINDNDNGFRASPPLGVISGRFDMNYGLQPVIDDGDPNTDLAIDFGFRPVQPLTVGDLVFRDANANGVFDTADSGIDGVVVNLLRDANDNGGLEAEEYTPVATTTTSGGGLYSFSGLTPGNYWLEVAASNFASGEPLENFASTEPSDGDANNGINDNDNGFRASPPLGVISGRFEMNYGLQPVIDDGDPNTDVAIDLGFRPVQSMTVGDLVFRDANANGIFDTGDSGLDGVVVNLLRDANDNGGLEVEEYTPQATTTTAGGGLYSFSGLTSGNYWLEIALSNFAPGQPLENLLSAEPTDGDANSGLDDTDNGSHAGPPLGVLSSRFDMILGFQPIAEDGDPNTDLAIDFGFRAAQPMSIGNQVFLELNANGRFDGADTGIDGVVVNLLRDANNNGGLDPEEQTPLATTTTSDGGRYSFTDVAAGNYWVEVALSNFSSGQPLENLVSTEPTDGDPNNGRDHDDNGFLFSAPVGVICNRFDMNVAFQPWLEDADPNTDLTIDFGFRSPATSPPVITRQPSDQTVIEHASVTFSVGVQGTPPFSYAWLRDGSPISGANGQSHTIPIVVAADDGAAFSVEVVNDFGNATSAEAVLTVLPDTTPPTALSAQALTSLSRVTVKFSEPLDLASAENTANYALSGGLLVSAASLNTDQRTVLLTTSPQTQGAAYTLTINNVADLSAPPNPIAPDTQVSFTAPQIQAGVLAFEAYHGVPGGSVTDLLSSPKYPDSPDFLSSVSSFDSTLAYPCCGHENYGGRVSGWLIPAESADYHLFLLSDDGSQLFLSSDDDPANAVLIAQEDGCCGPFEEPGAPETPSAISLRAGQRYFVMALWKEGGGGDYCRVAWRKVGDPTPANLLQPIPGEFLEGFNSLSPLLEVLSLGDLVFLDANANGVFDSGDSGLDGVIVNLYRDTNVNGGLDTDERTPVATTTTSSGGAYRFDTLAPGGYFVEIAASNFSAGQPLENLASTEPTDGDPNNGVDDNDNGTPTSPPLGVLSGVVWLDLGTEPVSEDSDANTDLTVDFGFRPALPMTIGNLVFRDANANGLFDAGDTGIEGVVVNLLRDANENGGLEPEEYTPVTTATTASGGLYSFSGVEPGNYWVEIAVGNFSSGQPLENTASTEPSDGDPNNGADNNDNGFQYGPPLGVLSARFDMNFGLQPVFDDGDPNTDLTIDFGFRSVQSMTIGNLVFRDASANGIYDSGDTGIDGVTVNLLHDANNDGGPGPEEYAPIATTTTAGGGFYSFGGVAPGAYWVEIALSNFAPGQPLENLASTEPTDGDANNGADDNDNGYQYGPPLGVASSRFDM
ncbi:MAG: Ig-like domain-containing protein, partial [Verrucomicrobia bacterium]|nr:Ig-like domain-containing protein [Verrucomicrobiota bacterium]